MIHAVGLHEHVCIDVVSAGVEDVRREGTVDGWQVGEPGVIQPLGIPEVDVAVSQLHNEDLRGGTYGSVWVTASGRSRTRPMRSTAKVRSPVRRWHQPRRRSSRNVHGSTTRSVAAPPRLDAKYCSRTWRCSPTARPNKVRTARGPTASS